ncbi:very-long-chain enoyl-CoA reductase isoform X2 [Hippopotamus amphibius kiboko]|uniref:very-long-chain enoyl-CoA reductase isoform X2 n=1 Tax=Hippopotamus amphibius kiboko TaxID=575201 RepID=UPI002594FA39|nr:very-long-chain enoyl-CoA reductase isoform X2 [Hippopotamus amphibius kiboko]
MKHCEEYWAEQTTASALRVSSSKPRPERGGLPGREESSLCRGLEARLHSCPMARDEARQGFVATQTPVDFIPRVEILDAKTREKLCFLDKVEPQATIAEIKNLFTKTHPQWYPARQSLRLDPKGKSLKDEDVLQKLPVGTTATLYFRDLGAQISWVTVFLTEYAGPLFIYLLFYFRVPFIYGHKYDFTSSRHTVVHLACICHSFHYIKRLLETLFVHRFSHGTMPLRNIFKNCTYYWGFAAWMAYYINHPLYTPPTYGAQQVKLALAIFVICQLGNFSIHMALRDLRPAGSKARKIPYPTKNPFTWLFLLVSCPNYTYEWPSSPWWASPR